MAANGSNIFAGCYGPGGESVFRSTNDGISWVQTSLNNIYVYSLGVYGNSIFAGTAPNSCYVSTNNGSSWTMRNEGFLDSGHVTVRAFCILNNYIFAGTANSNLDGVYRRPLGELVGIQPISNEVPYQFSLSQNYPNPFNPSTKIKFEIPLLRGVSEGSVRRTPLEGVLTSLIIFDVLGREIATLVNEQLNPGTYEVEWNASNYPSGVYYYSLVVTDPSTSLRVTDTKKMVLVK